MMASGSVTSILFQFEIYFICSVINLRFEDKRLLRQLSLGQTANLYRKTRPAYFDEPSKPHRHHHHHQPIPLI